MYQFNGRQQGFTLLELLVVITLLAILSVGALVAYEGIGENAADTAAANNIKTADSAIRAYRAVENKYPNQWDNLVNADGTQTDGAVSLLADQTKSWLTAMTVDPEDGVGQAVLASLGSVGVTEFQTLTSATQFNNQVIPNEAFNESAPGAWITAGDPADEIEWEFDDAEGEWELEGATTAAISVVANGGNGTCTAGGSLATPLAGTAATDSTFLNRINDALESDACHVVVAVGFGKDVPGTTLGSRVAISTAPTYTNGDVINPSKNYARYIALFHVATDGSDDSTPDGAITASEVLPKARLVAVVDTEGRNIDQAIAGAFAQN